MKTFKVKFHSFINLITNSSTEFFVDFSNSLLPCKEMINEILKVFGVTDKNCDDLFDIKLSDYVEGEEVAELLITAKDEKFENLAKLIKKFLESGENIEIMC